ncbi:FISUMP domain-containing protein [Roseimarinus sediminis]|uniref:FISUMP domain-containing protein n=1 Tax=Roseimarinus sediminis TaxID=1610899 RepID=UPI003D1D8073
MKNTQPNLLVVVFVMLFHLIACTDEPPNCTIQEPADNTVIEQGDTLLISVDASDSDGEVSEVEIRTNKLQIKTLTKAPYQFKWSTKNMLQGDYTIIAKASDDHGNTMEDAVQIQIIPKKEIPIIEAGDITDLNSQQARLSGTIQTDNNDAITERGFCWSTSEISPESFENCISIDSDSTTFSTLLENLTPNTSYYFVAYATNSIGTGYSQVLQFTTQPLPKSIPVLALPDTSGLTPYKVIVQAEITTNGNDSITECGFCFSTSEINPESFENCISIDSDSTTFSTLLENLTPNTSYYLVAYAVNSIGTGYSQVLQFTTQPLPKSIPVLALPDTSGLTPYKVIVQAEITTNGNDSITEHGFCWSTSEINPESFESCISIDSDSTTFSTLLENLTPNTSYYLVAYAVNNIGTGYSQVLQFTTQPLPKSIPELALRDTSGLTPYKVIVQAEITTNGNDSITERGFCFSTSEISPESFENCISIDSDSTTFSTLLEQLTPNTSYYVVAYASNSVGTGYSEVQSFSTPTVPVTLAQIKTLPATSITHNQAVLNGVLISDGNASPITGFRWSSEQTLPQKHEDFAVAKMVNDTIRFTVKGLEKNTKYYFLAFASNLKGSNHGEILEFTTPRLVTGEFTDKRDGKTYKTILIGEQEWMSENLAWLPEVMPDSITPSSDEAYYHVYNYHGSQLDEAKQNEMYKTHGVLYNWPAAQNACPIGWKLPTDEEWMELEMTIGMSSYAANSIGYRGYNQGTLLKANHSWLSADNYPDTYGFSALASGHIHSMRSDHLGVDAFWWTATFEKGSNLIWFRRLYNDGPTIIRSGTHRSYAYSVRCLKIR